MLFLTKPSTVKCSLQLLFSYFFFIQHTGYGLCFQLQKAWSVVIDLNMRQCIDYDLETKTRA